MGDVPKSGQEGSAYQMEQCLHQTPVAYRQLAGSAVDWLPMTRLFRGAAALAVAALAPAAGFAQPPNNPLARLEAGYDSLRYLRDQIAVTKDRGVQTSIHGQTLEGLMDLAASIRDEVRGELARVAVTRLRPSDRAAVAHIDQAFSRMGWPPGGTFAGGSGEAEPECRYDPSTIGRSDSAVGRLQARIFACYGHAAQHVIIGRDTLNRLTVLGLLGTTDDRARREQLFRALEPIWRSVNGADEPDSPYRVLIPLRRASWARPSNPFAERAASAGLTEAGLERWLVAALEAWRATLPDTVLEPWDFHHFVGAASRTLSPLVPRDSLIPVNRRFYLALGASIDSLGVRYDIDPRPAKYPTSYTTFGARPVERAGRWVRSEPWIFTSYQTGGFDNLFELLHETGHAVHIAAIRARPAYADWPDSDTFTEGIADLASLEVFEPSWQRTFLGHSAPLAESVRAKYGGVILDIAWALFELRAHRRGAPSPNAVWDDLMSRYLKIRPHPEWSWWAMRGQLVESPGYMMNYALGAFVVADVRRTLAMRYGPITTGRTSWYREVSDRIYRFGLARPADRIISDVLGRGVSSQALLDDLTRIR